jgi:acyl-CoA thioester hydrolase
MTDSFLFSFHVCFADTDSGGVVYHSRYLEFAERARAAMLHTKGLSNTLLSQQGIVFAVQDCHVRYHLPARLDDIVSIETLPQSIKGGRFTLTQKIWRQDALLATLHLTLACLNDKGKPVRIPQNVLEAFAGNALL